MQIESGSFNVLDDKLYKVWNLHSLKLEEYKNTKKWDWNISLQNSEN